MRGAEEEVYFHPDSGGLTDYKSLFSFGLSFSLFLNGAFRGHRGHTKT